MIFYLPLKYIHINNCIRHWINSVNVHISSVKNKVSFRFYFLYRLFLIQQYILYIPSRLFHAEVHRDYFATGYIYILQATIWTYLFRFSHTHQSLYTCSRFGVLLTQICVLILFCCFHTNSRYISQKMKPMSNIAMFIYLRVTIHSNSVVRLKSSNSYIVSSHGGQYCSNVFDLLLNFHWLSANN